MHTLTLETKKKDEIINITDKIEELLKKSKITDGLCTIFTAHTTCCITTADLDEGTDLDLLDALRSMLPKIDYRHPHDPDHAPDHILSSIIGPSVTVPIKQNRLVRGTWQEVILIELDGPRKRNIQVIAVSEDQTVSRGKKN